MDKKQTIKLPEEVSDFWGAEYSSDLSKQIAGDYNFSIGKIAGLTILVNDYFYKRKKIDEIEKHLTAEGLAQGEEVNKLALEVLGKKLLIADDIWFEGQVANKITALGGSPSDYKDIIEQYKVKVAEEKARLAEEDKAEREALAKEETIATAINPLDDPEEERKSSEIVFSTQIASLLAINDYATKMELNSRLVALLIDDKDNKFQQILLKALYDNKELLTEKNIMLKGEKTEPTIGNWLKDYIRFVGIEEAVSTLKKTQYFIDSPNVKILPPEEKDKLDALLDLYINLKNFQFNARKFDIEDLLIFPYSQEEMDQFTKDYENFLAEQKVREKNGEKGQTGELAKEEIDLQATLIGDEAEKKQIESEKVSLLKETRNQYAKIAPILEDHLLRRRRIKIIAALQALAEIGALDNLLAEFDSYKELMKKYFKRNNLQNEEVGFLKNPNQAKYVQHFLKFVFLERLGMLDYQGARYASQLSNIFRKIGATQYAQLAYLDLNDKKFKWTEL